MYEPATPCAATIELTPGYRTYSGCSTTLVWLMEWPASSVEMIESDSAFIAEQKYVSVSVHNKEALLVPQTLARRSTLKKAGSQRPQVDGIG